MVRKLCVGLLSAVLVAATVIVLGSLPSAAAGTVVVQVHNLEAANLFEFTNRCSTNGSAPAPQPLSLRSGSLGTHSIGWQYGATDFDVGPLAPVFQPSTLNTVAIDVFSPSGHTRGQAVAYYYDTTPGYTAGYWVGLRGITLDGAGWRAWNLTDVELVWNYYENGVRTAWYDDPFTVTELANLRGGAGRTWVGAALGCDGEAFYVDRLRVSDAVDQTTYDFEGAPSISGLYWYEVKKKHHKKKYVYHTGNLAVWYGTKFSLLGLGFDRSTQKVYAGTGTLYEKRHGSSAFAPSKGDGFDPGHFAVFGVKPKEQTTYAFVGGSDLYDTDDSNQITVDVVARLNARINDRSLKPGQRAVLTGRIAPGDRGTKVSLKRRIGSRWATVDSTRTGRGGAFGVSIKATRVGRMILRLEVAPPRRGVHGARSESVVVTVTPRPKPPSHQDGGGGNTTHTDTASTAGSSTAPTSPAPAPTPDDARLLVRLAGQSPSGMPPVSTEPVCTMPGPFLAPCPPVRPE